ncbi:hypothetical protein PR003_g19998 [Phytophthora rubi]|uniref:BZIP domain-containing protein n=1 Tax=Phytophthora rubi TaxID=129364 RepID=A0A6A4DRU4_9STRA|nr:hypothetical protein PR003_g19998 [Phytophthora rubi]
MSVLVADADDVATLEATLAFLDDWDAPSKEISSVDALVGVSTSSRCLTPQQQQQQHNAVVRTSPQRKKPRRKYPNSSSTVLQRRKKAEILALRFQVEQLEAQLEQLKQVPGATYAVAVEDAMLLSQKAEHGAITWAEQAALQCRRRLEAEQTNCKLRSVVASQINVSEALRTVLQRAAAMEGMDFLHPEPCRPLVDGLAGSLALLERRAEGLYLESDSVYRPGVMQLTSVQAMEKHSELLGKTVEIVSTTPMMCPLKEASDTLWKWFSLTKSLGDRPNILQRSYTLILESQIGPLEFQKQNFVRRYEEGDRVVIVWTDTLRLPQYQLQFRNQSWLFITPSADAPKETSVLRTYQQVFIDYEAGQPFEETSFPQELAFEEVIKLYRNYMQSQQNMMLNETGSATMIPEITV